MSFGLPVITDLINEVPDGFSRKKMFHAALKR